MTTATSTKKQDRKAAAQAQRKALATEAKTAQELAKANADEMEKFLTFMANLTGEFSEKNMWMLYTQNPEATHCQGFNKWKEAGRVVRKGEKGLKIFAPSKRKIRDEETGEKLIDEATGKDREQEFFIMVSVFDIAQTDPVEEETTD